MSTTKTTAEAERTGQEDGAGRVAEGAGRVRLKWDSSRPTVDAFHMTRCGVLLVVDKAKDGWLGSVAARDHESKTFDTKEEAQLGCESVLTGLLLRDLGSVLGENWTDAPGKTRLRMVMDIEADGVTGEQDHRAIHSFVIDRNTQQIRRLHTNECATNEGKPCNCPLNSTALGHE